jgi:4-oxalocrotonate tautomerase
MPVITFEGGRMDQGKKKDLIQRLTKAAADVTGIHAQAFVICIHENDPDNVGVGGEMLTEVLARENK